MDAMAVEGTADTAKTSVHANNVLHWTVRFIVLFALVYNARFLFVGFDHSLFDYHGFRQTQTAISARSMLSDWNFFHYETPVLGKPWSVPFEFPLYQNLVALLVRSFNWPMNETGRAISIVFYYLSLLPLISILKSLRYTSTKIYVVLALYLMSSEYIFWSRTFMIESTALFFSLMYVREIFQMTLCEERWTARGIVFAALFGSMAGVVKVTTFAPYFLLGAGVAISQIWNKWKQRSISTAMMAIATVFTTALPAILTLAWTKYADLQKLKSPLGRVFTSKAQASWVYGTLEERLRGRNYLHLAGAIRYHVGDLWLSLLVVALYIVIVKRWNKIAAVSFALYAATSLIFFNLYIVHEYYAYATALLLIVAVGTLLGELISEANQKAWVGLAFLLLMMCASAYRYREHYYHFQSWNNPGRPAVSAIIDKTTTPDSIILITGLDWSPELPYQSTRHALMDVVRVKPVVGLGPIKEAIAYTGPENIAEVIACDTERGTSRVASLLQAVGINGSTKLVGDDCDVFPRTNLQP